MIGPDWIYWLCGGFFIIVGVLIAFDRTHPRRWPTAAFWCLFGAALCAGNLVPSWLLGVAVIATALLGGFGLTGRGTVRTTSDAERDCVIFAAIARLAPMVDVAPCDVTSDADCETCVVACAASDAALDKVTFETIVNEEPREAGTPCEVESEAPVASMPACEVEREAPAD